MGWEKGELWREPSERGRGSRRGGNDKHGLSGMTSTVR